MIRLFSKKKADRIQQELGFRIGGEKLTNGQPKQVFVNGSWVTLA